MTDDAGQGLLRHHARSLVDDLMQCESRLRHLNGVHHFQHTEFAWRARSLGLYLTAAIDLCESLAYPQALAILRSALEHQLLDRLIFLGERYEQLTDRIDDDTWERWQVARPPDVVSWQRLPHGRVRIVWRGIRVNDADGSDAGYTMSIYYSWLRQHDPFAGAAGDLTLVAAGHPSEPEDAREYARTQRELWDSAFSWRNLKGNLSLNELLDERAIVQSDIHYRFLSAFVHPTSRRAAELLYAPNSSSTLPVYDHYAEELVLLYACWLASDELDAFEAMARRPPRVELNDWSQVQNRVAAAEELIEHGWFPSRSPTRYDRVIEANQRAFDRMPIRHSPGQPYEWPRADDPDNISNEDVRYYANPMTRLCRLHAGFSEGTTGLSWRSPWPRNDAMRRW